MRITNGGHRGSTREPKRIRLNRISTIDDKLKRHRRKARIWRRAVKRLAQHVIESREPAMA